MSAAVVTDQPEPQARLLFGRSSTESSLKLARTASKSTTQSAKLGLFGRQRNQSDASSRKMLISAPTDFRHLTSGSQHAFPAMPLSMHPSEVLHAPPTREFLRIPGQSASTYDWEPESRREGLRAVEPSEFRKFRAQNRLSPLLPPFELPFISPTPPPAYVREEAERSSVLHPQGSMQSLSCVSTRATPESFSNSSSVSEWNSSPRSSTYATKSSKKTAQSGPHTAPAVEAIRARVVTAMQEVERLQKKIDNVVERQSLYTTSRPSILRPPLRKKKPFSGRFSGRFSGFVFSEPPRESSLDCVTKIKDIDGFYRCVPDNGSHHSYESLHSMSTSNCGDNSETGSQISLYYTPSPHELPTPVERCATFGQEPKELPFSVGIAL
ncbi:hypothetical protein MY3296_004249 [Beauveria thailandica]